MVYTGPSDGCHLCRKRRIKCDGGRPGCQRCAIYKTKCPGYRAESDYRFVNESNSSDSKGSTPSRRKSSTSKATAVRSARASTSSQPARSSGSSSANDAIPEEVQGSPALDDDFARNDSLTTRSEPSWDLVSSPKSGPTPDWEEWSVSSFLHDWTLPETTSGFGIGFLEFLPELYANTTLETDFSLALRAGAFASFANKHNTPAMMAKAGASYGQALTALNTSLRKRVDAVKDTTIASIVMLQIFEHITCNDTLSIGNHDAGLRMLLEMRGDSQLDNPQGRGIARITFAYLFSRDVSIKRGTSDVMKRGAHRLGFPPDHPSRHRRPGSTGMPELFAKLLPLLAEDPCDPKVRAEALQLMHEAVLYDQIYDGWANSISAGWRPRDVSVTFDHSSSSATTVPRSGIVHMYESPLHACYSSTFRIQYVILHKRLIRMAKHLGITDWSLPISEECPEGYHESIERSLAKIYEINDQIIGAAACAMGEVTPEGDKGHITAGRSAGAYYLLWPLTHVSQDELATQQQREDALRALSYIGHMLGIKRAIRRPNRPLSQGNSPRGGWDVPAGPSSSNRSVSVASSSSSISTAKSPPPLTANNTASNTTTLPRRASPLATTSTTNIL